MTWQGNRKLKSTFVEGLQAIVDLVAMKSLLMNLQVLLCELR